MLNEFDDYSNGRYLNAINKKVISIEFEILKAERKVKQLKIPKYKKIYGSLGSKEKTKMYISCYFPNTYCKLSNIKRYIKEKL